MAEKRLKALVVDTDREHIAHLSVLLRKMGFGKIVSAESGEEALRVISLWPPDMVILEAGTDSMETLLKSIDKLRQMPAIALTAQGDGAARGRLMKAGALDVIQKPVALARLNSAVQEAIAACGINRRQHMRAPYRGIVRLVHKGRSLSLEARNLSEGGIFIYMDAPPPVGSMPQVGLALGGRRRLLRGRVIYHLNLPRGQSGPLSPHLRGMAVKFTRLNDEARAALRREVEGLLEGKR